MCEESGKEPRYVGLIQKKILKKNWGNEKKYPWTEILICVFLFERKKTALKLPYSFLNHEKYKSIASKKTDFQI